MIHIDASQELCIRRFHYELMLTLKKRLPLSFSVILLIVLALSRSVAAASTFFTVHAGEEVNRSLDLAVDDHVFLRFSVGTGQSSDSINVKMICPNGTEITFGNIIDYEYTFTCTEQRTYVLHFTNSGSHDLSLSFDCEIDHYVMGLPQMLFLALIVTVLCVAAVAVFIIIGRQR